MIITEDKKSPLRDIAKIYNCYVLDHPMDIGGRYSVFSNVGLLPACIGGLNISDVRLGAYDLLQEVYAGNFTEHLKSSELIFSLYEEKKINISVIMTYADSLINFGKWYLQLWSESIGKNLKGITPMHSIGTIDQHSQLQLYLDGPKDKFFSIFTKNHSNLGMKMNDEILLKCNVNYLAGKKMGDLMHAERQATLDTFVSKGFPIREIYCEEINEFTIGQLMVFSILETISICTMLNVNPFNQPAVEEGKLLTKKYLS